MTSLTFVISMRWDHGNGADSDSSWLQPSSLLVQQSASQSDTSLILALIM